MLKQWGDAAEQRLALKGSEIGKDLGNTNCSKLAGFKEFKKQSGENIMKNNVPKTYGAAAQSIAPFGIIMALFSLVYSIWFGFDWGLLGWILFFGVFLSAIYRIASSIRQIKHAKQFPVYDSPEGKKIGKQMSILSSVTYIPIWISIIGLFILGREIYILPIVTLMIGLHFLPQAQIFNRNIDYYLAPFPIISGIASFYLAWQSAYSWIIIFAIAGIGGVIATLGYGFILTRSYRKLAADNGVPYN